jgi:hypothetical protein
MRKGAGCPVSARTGRHPGWSSKHPALHFLFPRLRFTFSKILSFTTYIIVNPITFFSRYPLHEENHYSIHHPLALWIQTAVIFEFIARFYFFLARPVDCIISANQSSVNLLVHTLL